LASGGAAALAFAAIAYATRTGASLRFDEQVSWAVHSVGGTGTSVVMVMLTTLAEPVMAVALSLMVAWLAFGRGDMRASAVAAGTVWAAAGINFALKHLFHRARPTLWMSHDGSAGFGFPSWHAMAAVAVGGTLALVLGRLYPRARIAAGVGAAILGAGIVLSRVYLGLHWPTDVLAGACAGWVVLLAAASLLEARPALGSAELSPRARR
jgi:undecaprenyl-diphosphatase